MSVVIVGTPVPWYRVNGWIQQSGGVRDGYVWSRWQFLILGVVLAQTPWQIDCTAQCSCMAEDAP